ncbi:MAG: NUDIX domain-containing protein [Arachnia sp.]
MRVVGVLSPVGSQRVDVTIRHGEHPAEALFSHGFVPVRPLGAHLVADEIVFTYLVRDVLPDDRRPRRRHVVHEEPTAAQQPVVHQRIGAYAVVLSERGLLGTVNSSLTGAPGTWTLPGGGIDPGESPSQAVLREVFEEAGQQIRIVRVLALESDHWIGRSTNGVLEDFHALRIVYGATSEAPSDPVVHDLGGSTERADWVPLRTWRTLHWTISSRTLLARHLRSLHGHQFLK